MLPDKPCDDFAPDTFAPDYEDGIDGTKFCLRCGYHATDHKENTWTICPFCRDDNKSCNACDDSYTEVI